MCPVRPTVDDNVTIGCVDESQCGPSFCSPEFLGLHGTIRVDAKVDTESQGTYRISFNASGGYAPCWFRESEVFCYIST